MVISAFRRLNKMSDTEAINKFIRDTCLLAIKHQKNIFQLQKSIDKSLGYHSRLLERMFHPEEVLIYKGRSKALMESNSPAYKEHIVPMGYLLNEIWKMIEQGREEEAMAEILQANLGIAYITCEEAARLNNKPLSLKCTMPQGWQLGVDDPLKRLEAAEIILLDEHKNKITSLLKMPLNSLYNP